MKLARTNEFRILMHFLKFQGDFFFNTIYQYKLFRPSWQDFSLAKKVIGESFPHQETNEKKHTA